MDIQGKKIENIYIHRFDRQIIFKFSQEQGYLLFQLFGTSGNVFHLDNEFVVQEQYKKNKNFEIPKKIDFVDVNYLNNETLTKSIFFEHKDKSIMQFLISLPYKFFSKHLRLEICCRSEISQNELIVNLSDEEENNLLRTIGCIIEEINNPVFYIYNSKPKFISFIKMHYANCTYDLFDNFLEFQKQFISSYYGEYYFLLKKKELLQRINKFIFLLDKRLVSQRNNYKNLPDISTYKEYGDTILSNIYRIPKNISEIELPRLMFPEEKLLISLNKKLTPAENANKYYKKSNNITASRNDLRQSIKNNKIIKEQMQSLLTQIDLVEQMKELRKIEKSLPKELIKQQEREDSFTRLSYKTYEYKGWDILIGKSAKDNDTLTLKIGRSDDFWLHASKITGSHVIVRNPEKKDNLPNDVLVRAAGIAGAYSKAKHSTVVPVIYTKRKYVYKKKSMLPGQVNVQYEKCIIVEPFMP